MFLIKLAKSENQVSLLGQHGALQIHFDLPLQKNCWKGLVLCSMHKLNVLFIRSGMYLNIPLIFLKVSKSEIFLPKNSSCLSTGIPYAKPKINLGLTKWTFFFSKNKKKVKRVKRNHVCVCVFCRKYFIESPQELSLYIKEPPSMCTFYIWKFNTIQSLMWPGFAVS